MMTLAAFLSLAIGLALGLLGGGGSILTLPILVYVVGIDEKAAIASSLFVVAATSLSVLFAHARKKNVDFGSGMVFAAAGMVGASLGGFAAKFLPTSLLLIAFALLMLATAVAMIRGKRSSSENPADGIVKRSALVKYGFWVGLLTGTVGAGGGFLVVPALVLFAGLPMQRAVGTSLLVITLNSAAGFFGHFSHATIAWPVTALVTLMAVGGAQVGAYYAPRIHQESLRKAFGYFVLLMGLFMLMKQLPLPVWNTSIVTFLGGIRVENFTPRAALEGGVLIGLATSVLLVFNGKIAGISGIVGSLFSPSRGDTAWRLFFVAGLILGGFFTLHVSGGSGAAPLATPSGLVSLAGLLVGFGSRLGNGCTSGHGVCGVSRFSNRSVVATLTFIAAGAVAVVAQKLLVP